MNNPLNISWTPELIVGCVSAGLTALGIIVRIAGGGPRDGEGPRVAIEHQPNSETRTPQPKRSKPQVEPTRHKSVAVDTDLERCQRVLERRYVTNLSKRPMTRGEMASLPVGTAMVGGHPVTDPDELHDILKALRAGQDSWNVPFIDVLYGKDGGGKGAVPPPPPGRSPEAGGEAVTRKSSALTELFDDFLGSEPGEADRNPWGSGS